MRLVVVGADADLHRAARVDQPLLDGVEEHGAVIDAPRLVPPGVRMGVEVHQRQGAERPGVGAQVTTEP